MTNENMLYKIGSSNFYIRKTKSYLSDVSIAKSHFSQRKMDGGDSRTFHVDDGRGRGPSQFFSEGRNVARSRVGRTRVGRTRDRDAATGTENDRSPRSRRRPRPA